MKRVKVLRAIMGLVAFTALSVAPAFAAQEDAAPGQLAIVGKDGKVGGLCPLQKTKVNADISGFGARVVVVQSFTNPTQEAIEAVYTFPLPHEAAVDRMRMRVGDQIVEGEIKRSEEARAVYEAAKNAGQVASLLDQERPNIFTQSVANIMPGAKIEVEISYVQILKYEAGQFEFNYPMVVGPRFLGNAPDPGKIAPPITPEGTRTGAGIELKVNLNAGAPIVEMKSVLHDVDIKGTKGGSQAVVTLRKEDEIPNRDFILRYKTATDSVQSAFITHMDQQKGGFFQLVLLPPKAVKPAQIAPREIVFLIDHSGSQQGLPIEKSKELTLKLMDTLRPGDAFNVVSFADDYVMLWKGPREATKANVAEAKAFIKKLGGDGGTEMLKALHAAIASFTGESGRIPIMLFNTDGFVGDEANILKAIREEHGKIRIFTFGIGDGCNRSLIEGMSAEGRGDAEYVTLREEADPAVKRLVQRLEAPVLTDVQVRFEGVEVTQSLPALVPDVFSEKPIMICGRYKDGGEGTLIISGNVGGEPWSRSIPVVFGTASDAPAVQTLWARRKVDDLSRKEPYATSEDGKATVRDAIIETALAFGIMSEYTSFVAVEKKVVNIGGKQRTVAVPVEMTEGVSYEGTVGPASTSGFTANLSSTRVSQHGVILQKARIGGVASAGPAKFGRTVNAPMRAKAVNVGGLVMAEDLKAPIAMRPILANGVKVADPVKATNYTNKVSKKLQSAKGPVEIQVLLRAVDAASLNKLAALGLKIYDADKRLKVVFAACDAKKLLALAQLDFVKLISPL